MTWDPSVMIYPTSLVGGFSCYAVASEPNSPNRGYAECSLEEAVRFHPRAYLSQIDRVEERAIVIAKQALAIEPHPSRWDEIND